MELSIVFLHFAHSSTLLPISHIEYRISNIEYRISNIDIDIECKSSIRIFIFLQY